MVKLGSGPGIPTACAVFFCHLTINDADNRPRDGLVYHIGKTYLDILTQTS